MVRHVDAWMFQTSNTEMNCNRHYMVIHKVYSFLSSYIATSTYLNVLGYTIANVLLALFCSQNR